MGNTSRRSKWLVVVALIGLGLALSFNNCSQTNMSASSTDVSSQQSTNCGENLNESLRNPTTIDQTVTSIQLLPKPLSIDCFLKALKKPLKVYAVNSTFSAQPAGGFTSPRIFIINGNLLLSVVPAGLGSRNLELSELVSGTSSVKAEIEFPLEGNISRSEPFSRILESTGGATTCRNCHLNEGRNYNYKNGEAYTSNIMFPDSYKRVSQTLLQGWASSCDLQKDRFRCLMLMAIFIDGQAQDVPSFPSGPAN